MKTVILPLLFAALAVMVPQAHADDVSDKLGICMTDNLTGKERKMLAQWIFFGMSTHQQLQPFTNISGEDREQTNKTIGALITRLLTSDCAAETKAAVREKGGLAMQGAFELVGRVAVQELLTDPNVLASMTAFQAYLDKEKFSALDKE